MIESFRNLIDMAVTLFGAFVTWVVSVIEKFGYAGVFLGMMLESSFVPFPSEVIVPPAGYLTVKGDMSIILVILAGTLGSVTGALTNYYLGKHFGRKFLVKYSKFLFLNEKRIDWMDRYFKKHGEITTLLGRMIPVVRQYISFPAGIAKMHLGKFLLYTAIGAGAWVTVLALIGRSVGNNIDLVKDHLHLAAKITSPILLFMIVVYIMARRYFHKKLESVD